jgi:hypothetical protein
MEKEKKDLSIVSLYGGKIYTIKKSARNRYIPETVAAD